MNLESQYSFRSLLDYTAKHEPKWQEENAAAIAAMQQFPFTSNFWLSGRVGSCKTRLAMAAASRHQDRWEKGIRKAGMYPEHFTLSEVLYGPDLRGIATQLPNDREEDVCKFARPLFLIIDDIDKVDLTNTKPLETLSEILNYRQVRGDRLTIVTSNFSIHSLKENWEDACRHNKTFAASILDRLRPCKEFSITALKSLRGREPIKTPPAPEPVELVSPEEAEAVRRMIRNVNPGEAA